MKLLIAGEMPRRSAPTLTLAHCLSEHGIDCRFSNGAEGHCTGEWIRRVRESDAILMVDYGGPDAYMRRQMAIAAALGRPIIRRWAGSDVWNCLRSEKLRKEALEFERLVALSITPAEHLVAELKSIGIRATLIPPLINLRPLQEGGIGQHVPNSLLVYLTTNRHAFFGKSFVERAVRANRDIRFVIVADDTHSLAHYDNVTSLGWVADMGPVWQQVGGLLRITEHDGMPRTVLEGLALGKYVIYAWPFPGCWLAKTHDEVQERIDAFKSVQGINQEGVEAANRLLRPDAGQEVAELLKCAVGTRALRKRIRGALTVVASTTELKCSPHFGLESKPT